jgi:Mg2+/Co2+ transporter CorB
LADIPIGVLFVTLILLLVFSGFFSGSETGLMRLNRYRLRHLAQAGHGGAVRAQNLLQTPDRLIGLILLGNNFVNILITQLATYIGYRVYGEVGVAIATGLLTLVLLIFAEVAPKTLAAMHSERIAFPASYVFGPLLKIAWPLVWVVNQLANGVLRLVGVGPEETSAEALSREELRTIVHEAAPHISKKHQAMLISILDLEEVTVEDIMVPRNEIVGVDLDDGWDEIEQQIINTRHTRLPVFHESIDQIVGLVHVKRILPLIAKGELNRETLSQLVREPYFIPESTTLTRQLLNFQRERRRVGFVVDEYGDIDGLVTMEDILEEIVGEFTTDPSAQSRDIMAQPDGSYLVDGGTHVRELNRVLGLELPVDGPKTLNGLILEYLEMIPEPGTSLLLSGYPIEIIQTKGNAVKVAKIQPLQRRPVPLEESPEP